MFLVISNPVIERLRLPKGLARAAQQLVCLARGEPFPALDDRTQSVIGHRPQDCVNVIGHNYPRLQQVAFPLKKSNCPRNQFSYLRFLQPAFPATAIKVSFYFSLVVVLDFIQRLGFRRVNLRLFRRRLLNVESRQPLGALGLNFYKDLLRQRISQTKSDKITRAFPLNVRQIAASVRPRLQPTLLPGLDAGRPQLKSHTLQSLIALRGKHRRALSHELSASQPRNTNFRKAFRIADFRGADVRNADFQSAVSQMFNLPCIGKYKCLLSSRTQQIASLHAQQTASLRYSRLKICVTTPLPSFCRSVTIFSKINTALKRTETDMKNLLIIICASLISGFSAGAASLPGAAVSVKLIYE
jgi:hypothetical protein